MNAAATNGFGIWDRAIADMPVAVLDFETTGMFAGPDRVVEVSVVRCDPGAEPRLVLDTLIHPERRVAATHIHGICDADVANAPRFADVAGHLVDALAGCVFAAYNAAFDLKFLVEELSRVGVRVAPPHLCLMYMRPLLDIGRRCSLGAACQAHGITIPRAHAAADDTMAAAQLWQQYRFALTGRGIHTFRDLAGLRSYKFIDSFAAEPLCSNNAVELSRGPLKPRRNLAAAPAKDARQAYWRALQDVLGEPTEDRIAGLQAVQDILDLTMADLRGLHARALSHALTDAIRDAQVSDQAVVRLQIVYSALSQLGYAPGE